MTMTRLTTGSLSSKIVFVLEQPVIQDVYTQKLLSDHSGKLLKRLLASENMLGDDILFCTLYPAPFKTEVKQIHSTKAKGLQTTEYFDKCRVELFEFLKTLSPNVIVPVGEQALTALTGEQGIDKYRGSVLKVVSKKSVYDPKNLDPYKASMQTPALPCKVIPFLDPKRANADWSSTRIMLMDLARIKYQAEFPEFPELNQTIYLNPSLDDAVSFIESCTQSSQVGFDIETHHRSVGCLAIAPNSNTAMCIPFVRNEVCNYRKEREALIWYKLAKLFINPDITIIGQNLFFDYAFIYQLYGIQMNSIADTMIAGAILAPGLPKSLGFFTSLYTLQPYYKDDGKKYFNSQTPLDEEQFWLYNARDAIVLPEIIDAQLSALKAQGNYETYKRQLNILPALVYLSEIGMNVDVEARKEASAIAEKRSSKLKTKLKKLVGEHWTDKFPSSPKQLMDYFYVEKRYAPITDQGKLTTNEKALKQLRAKGSKEADLLLEIRGLDKLNSTYLKSKLDKDNRIRGAWNPVGTINGRISSSKTVYNTGSNMQNLPSSMKRYLTADPGHLLLNIDLGQAENRLVALISGCKAMLSAFHNGVDIHSKTASLIFGIPIEEVSKIPGELSSSPSEFERELLTDSKFSHRAIGKMGNHSLNYKIGPIQFSRHTGLPVAAAKKIMQEYFRAYPEVSQMHNLIDQELRDTSALTNLFGRKRVFFGRFNNPKDPVFKEGYNFNPQSTVADIVNTWGIGYWMKNREMHRLKFLCTVHDSLVYEFPLDKDLTSMDVCKLIWKLKSSLEQPLIYKSREIFIPADIALGHNAAPISKENPLGEDEFDGTTIEELDRFMVRVYERHRTSLPVS